MAVDFPNAPNTGDTFTSGSTSWQWNGAEWVAAPAGNWTEAPSDNQLYARRNLSWTLEPIQRDAPTDGQSYRRQWQGNAMAWTIDPIAVDAPAQVETYYGRVNGAWGVLSPTFTLKTYVDAQDTATLSSANSHTDGIAVPIGGIVMFGSPTAPANFLNCDGTVYNISSVPKLAAVISNRYGGNGTTTIAVPNMGGRLPCQTTIGAVGGAGSVSLGVANLPVHQHLVPAHTHSASSPAHTHGDPGHTHGVNDPGHQHSLTSNPLIGASGGNAPGGVGWAFSAVNTNYSGTGISIATGYTNLYAAAVGVNVASNGPWATDASWGQGSAAAFDIYPPYLGFNFIIRYQ
jgi:microcystin-dependent protein